MSHRILAIEDLEGRTLLAGDLLVDQPPVTQPVPAFSSFMDLSVYQIVVTPARDVIDISESVQFTAVALDRAGMPLDQQPRFVRWEVQNRSLGSIDQQGLFTALNRGYRFNSGR